MKNLACTGLIALLVGCSNLNSGVQKETETPGNYVKITINRTRHLDFRSSKPAYFITKIENSKNYAQEENAGGKKYNLELYSSNGSLLGKYPAYVSSTCELLMEKNPLTKKGGGIVVLEEILARIPSYTNLYELKIKDNGASKKLPFKESPSADFFIN